MKINLQLHVEEFEFIKVAIQQKTKSLIDYMDGSRKIAVGIERMNEEYLQEQASSIAEEEFEKELGKVTNKKKAVFAYRKKPKSAPYGLKKDGTPKAKPGRKV
jgi:hypothetical protein